MGSKEIRFQADQAVQRSISNALRYAADSEEKPVYKAELTAQVAARRAKEEDEAANSLAAARQQEEEEGSQWGKAGPGGAYWRQSAITGQGFLDSLVGS